MSASLVWVMLAAVFGFIAGWVISEAWREMRWRRTCEEAMREARESFFAWRKDLAQTWRAEHDGQGGLTFFVDPANASASDRNTGISADEPLATVTAAWVKAELMQEVREEQGP